MKKSKLIGLIKEIKEEIEQEACHKKLKEEDSEYQKFFKKTLDKFGVESPDELEDEKKKEFFAFIEKKWKAKDESKEIFNFNKSLAIDFINKQDTKYARTLREKAKYLVAKLNPREIPNLKIWHEVLKISRGFYESKEIDKMKDLIKECVKELNEDKSLLTESTRSRIGIMDKNGKIKSIYCHFDGYLQGVGQILKKYYKDPQKVKQLIDLGDISILDKEIGTKHDFNNPPKDEVTAYGRDRGEKNVKPKIDKDFDEFIKTTDSSDGEYGYIFDLKDKKWKYFKMYPMYGDRKINIL